MSVGTYFESTDMRKNFKACKKAYFKLWEEREKLKQENKQLREALQICSPWEAYIPENTNIWMPCCKFCRHISVPDITLEESMKYHTDDCEYIKLTEGK